jgi:protein-disulfide isomerase
LNAASPRAAFGGLIAAALLTLPAPARPADAPQDDLRAARTRGSPTAPVTVYEMGDFQCPVCARFARETMPLLEREYIATGKVRWVFVNFPLPMHPNAEPAAELAMCAAKQDRFWAMHDLLYRHQDRWAELHEPATVFLSLADSAGIDRERVVQCLRSGATRELVRADAEGSTRSGATGTPNFYIEGGLIRGALPMGAFRQVLDSIVGVKTRPAAR